MASTYSPSLRLELMATGDQSGTWGDTTNTNLGTLLEQAITGYLSKAMADTNQTLTNLNGASDEARNMVLNLTGALTAGRNVVVPTANKVYLVRNSTTGNFAVTVKTSAGTGVAVYPGQTRWVACDGTNVVDYAVPKFLDSQFLLADDADVTKLAVFQLSGITTGQTRTVTWPDVSGTMALTGDLTNFSTVVETLKDFIVNGDMQVSQENGTASGTTNGYFGADQWATYRVTSAGVITTQRVAARTPAGGSYRYRVTITTPDASLAAGEYLTITQPLEGSNVQAFLYGTASASASVLRFGFNAPAGTYAARFGNSAANRSFVALFTIAGGQANTDTVQEISIPGDTTGTWLTADGVIGITLDIVLACGSTFQGATGWQAGNILGTSAVSNGMGTGSAVFELFDVGLKLDPDATGVYGQYEVGATDAVYRPERYYEYQNQVDGVAVQYASAFVGFNNTPFKATKAKTPNVGVTYQSGVFMGTTVIGAVQGTQPSLWGIAPIFNVTGGAVGNVGDIRISFSANARLS